MVDKTRHQFVFAYIGDPTHAAAIMPAEGAGVADLATRFDVERGCFRQDFDFVASHRFVNGQAFLNDGQDVALLDRIAVGIMVDAAGG